MQKCDEKKENNEVIQMKAKHEDLHEFLARMILHFWSNELEYLRSTKYHD